MNYFFQWEVKSTLKIDINLLNVAIAALVEDGEKPQQHTNSTQLPDTAPDWELRVDKGSRLKLTFAA